MAMNSAVPQHRHVGPRQQRAQPHEIEASMPHASRPRRAIPERPNDHQHPHDAIQRRQPRRESSKMGGMKVIGSSSGRDT